VQRKSPHVIFSALVPAMAVVVPTGMAAATASTLAAIMVFIIGTAAGVWDGAACSSIICALSNPGATVT